jgi:sugar PTS system EIIA component
MQILAPCPGRVFSITEVSDPVFAGEIVGPGVAIEPSPGRTTVVAPVAGTILKLHPHAFAMLTPEGLGILVHLGINTVRLHGEGFELIAEEKSTVAAGDPIVSWDPAMISGDDITPTVMVVVMDRPAGSVTSEAIGHDIETGEPLFSVDV